MSTSLLISSILIGFSIAAPVGPIGVLVIRRTLSEGRWMGLITGLGAAVADTVYGAVGAFGLTLMTTWLVTGEEWLRLIGGLFLCGLGIRTLLAPPATTPAPATAATHLRAFVTTFALTLTNPLTILSFIGVFAGLGLATESKDAVAALTVVGGVFIGSALWWVALSGGVALLRHRITPSVLIWVNRLSGVMVLGFGLYALFER
jgi:threonine/homoserine/homoserine lactone efflux protein